MILAQISDIHCGSQFREKIFDDAIKEINHLNPDGVIVTGDLTEEGLVSQYRQAKKSLEKIESEHIIMCAGNHDYRSTGYYLFKHFFQPRQIVTLDDTLFVTLGTARPERNDGELGFRQIEWLKHTLDEHTEKHKVVVMHHHVLPVPNTGSDRNTIVDAGDLLRVLARSDIDLVLCGHRHRPWIWQLEGINVINAGTVSSERTRGFFVNSYNIIDIRENEIKAHVKIVGGKKIKLKNVLKHEYLHLPPKNLT